MPILVRYLRPAMFVGCEFQHGKELRLCLTCGSEGLQVRSDVQARRVHQAKHSLVQAQQPEIIVLHGREDE